MTQTNAQASPTLALTSTWLDANAQATGTAFSSSTLNANCTNAVVGSTLTYWPYWSYPYYGPARPIRLGLSEIAKLKQAAKRDAKLKAILAKFTDLIEVAVDFE